MHKNTDPYGGIFGVVSYSICFKMRNGHQFCELLASRTPSRVHCLRLEPHIMAREKSTIFLIKVADVWKSIWESLFEVCWKDLLKVWLGKVDRKECWKSIPGKKCWKRESWEGWEGCIWSIHIYHGVDVLQTAPKYLCWPEFTGMCEITKGVLATGSSKQCGAKGAFFAERVMWHSLEHLRPDRPILTIRHPKRPLKRPVERVLGSKTHDEKFIVRW